MGVVGVKAVAVAVVRASMLRIVGIGAMLDDNMNIMIVVTEKSRCSMQRKWTWRVERSMAGGSSVLGRIE
jgi:hypothetical protein